MRGLQTPLWIWAALCCTAVAGCGSHSRRAIEGTVTINGVPMDLGMITFTPADSSGGQTSVGGKVTDGTYSLDATRGPLPGTYKVEISWSKKTGRKVKTGDGGLMDEMKEGLPAKFNRNSELTTEVTSSTRRADFNLTP
jgi:hypothetical protein